MAHERLERLQDQPVPDDCPVDAVLGEVDDAAQAGLDDLLPSDAVVHLSSVGSLKGQVLVMSECTFNFSAVLCKNKFCQLLYSWKINKVKFNSSLHYFFLQIKECMMETSVLLVVGRVHEHWRRHNSH